MSFFERNRNKFFLGIQLMSWGFINLTSIAFLKKMGPSFIIISILAGMVIGILSTSLLRYYLKRNINLDNFSGKDLGKTVVAVLIGSTLYAILHLCFGLAYKKWGPSIPDAQKKVLEALDGPWILIFNSLFIVTAWAIAYLVVKLLLRLNKNRMERLEMNSNLKQAQLNTLKGQINPHFMFNSLNNIRGLMLEDVEKSRDMLTKLSEMLRYSLTKNDVNAIALEEEIEMVDNYIELSKIQFEDRLKFTKKIEEGCGQILIPPMIIQLLVENAAKHGISNLKNGGEIIVEVGKNSEHLNITVKNSGQLKLADNSTQLGIKNIKQRLNLLYGEKGRFALKEQDDFVVADIKIPLS